MTNRDRRDAWRRRFLAIIKAFTRVMDDNRRVRPIHNLGDEFFSLATALESLLRLAHDLVCALKITPLQKVLQLVGRVLWCERTYPRSSLVACHACRGLLTIYKFSGNMVVVK